jgi:hypothetical protein
MILAIITSSVAAGQCGPACPVAYQAGHTPLRMYKQANEHGQRRGGARA